METWSYYNGKQACCYPRKLSAPPNRNETGPRIFRFAFKPCILLLNLLVCWGSSINNSVCWMRQEVPTSATGRLLTCYRKGLSMKLSAEVIQWASITFLSKQKRMVSFFADFVQNSLNCTQHHQLKEKTVRKLVRASESTGQLPHKLNLVP